MTVAKAKSDMESRSKSAELKSSNEVSQNIVKEFLRVLADMEKESSYNSQVPHISPEVLLHACASEIEALGHNESLVLTYDIIA